MQTCQCGYNQCFGVVLSRFIYDRFEPAYKSGIGVDFLTRTIKISGHNARIQVWDTAGQERFRSITASYYRGVESIALVYDVTLRKSYMNLSYWMKEVREKARPDAVVVLIGTKTDCGRLRQVSSDEGQIFAAEYGMTFLETSALENDNGKGNVHEAFMTILTEVYLHKKYRELDRWTVDKTVATTDTRKSIWLPFLPSTAMMPTRCW